jgi:hypothetical protein
MFPYGIKPPSAPRLVVMRGWRASEKPKSWGEPERLRLIKLLRLQVHLTHLLVDPDLKPAKRRKIDARMLELDGWILGGAAWLLI